MLVNEIIEIIRKKAPEELAESWDNSGFLCGDANANVNIAYLTLDVNRYTVNEAVKNNADIIISHHPILFNGIKRINFNDLDGYILKSLIKNNISLYAAHTNLDKAIGGINDVLAEKLGIKDTDIIEKDERFQNCGLGRIGKIKNKMSLKNFAELVKKTLNTPFVRICGDPDNIVEVIAVGSGACDDLIPAAKAMGADVMVTSDMKYHGALDGVESGICVIDAGHYPTEFFVVDIFEKMLKNTEIKIIKSTQKDVFNLV